MAKPFGKADYVLIADAINEAVDEFVINRSVLSQLETLQENKNLLPSTALHFLSKKILNQLIESFKNKLKYTSDSFDPAKFQDLFR